MKLPKVETIVILIFLGSVLLWGMSKCSAKRSELASRNRTEEEEDRPARKADTVFVPAQPTQGAVSTLPQPNPYPATQPAGGVTYPPAGTYQQPTQQPVQYAPRPGRTPQNTPSVPAPTQANSAQPAAAAPKYSTLFVTIDGLKVRKEAGLKGAAVTKLDLYEQVYFLNQKTEWTQEISLGKEKVTDHWVKIRTKSGKEGWVFGAGVHYYKMKRKGTLE